MATSMEAELQKVEAHAVITNLWGVLQGTSPQAQDLLGFQLQMQAETPAITRHGFHSI